MSDTTWTIGDIVRDRDDDDPDPAIVVNTPSVAADEWTIPPIDKTAAEDNPDYPADAPIIVVVFDDILTESYPDWERNDPLPIAELNDNGVKHYSFPAPRLEAVEATDSRDTDADSDTDSAPNDEPPSSATADATHTTESTAPTTDTSTGASTANPSAAVHALEQRLDEGGMTTELEADGRTIRATKLGETYRVRPGQVLAGDGALRSRLEEIVDAAKSQRT